MAGTSAALQAFSPAEPERADDPATDDELGEEDDYVDIATGTDDPNESFAGFGDEDGDNNGQETY